MAFTDKDPHNVGEILRVVALGARIQRRQARGKSVKALENRVDRIREQAQKREDGKRKK
ncbi:MULTISPECIES: hypothetical protein [Streptomyces]|uniref:hypothetical protein n=1 Tax=Streptomyces TaxID=1883 RepID=UPI00142E4C1D|nr:MULTISPECIES: hypothetical protein [Streptomyces]